MKALVTGSNGFIGKKLVYLLKVKGFFVKEFDSANNKSVLNQSQLEQELKGTDIVFHLAAILDEDDPQLFEVNVHGTKNILEASSKAHVKQFVFLSSVGVMGDVQEIADENTPLNPKTRYEQSKAQAEQAVLSYQEVLPITIIRSALVLGANKYWKKIIEMITENKPLIGDGENKWQIVYSGDLVDALIFLAGKDEALGETFIVAEKEPKKLIEIVEFIRKEKKVEGELKKMPVWLAKISATIYSFVSKITGKKTFFTGEIIDRLTRERIYSTKKIESLGWQAKIDTFSALEKTMEEIK